MKRRRIEIEGQNYYIVVGKTFCQVTVPHENRNQTRSILDPICEVITEMLEEAQFEHEMDGT